MKTLKQLFKRLTPQQVAFTELQEARLKLLEACTGLEWAKSSVEYNQARIKRLEAFLKAGEAA